MDGRQEARPRPGGIYRCRSEIESSGRCDQKGEKRGKKMDLVCPEGKISLGEPGAERLPAPAFEPPMVHASPPPRRGRERVYPTGQLYRRMEIPFRFSERSRPSRQPESLGKRLPLPHRLSQKAKCLSPQK